VNLRKGASRVGLIAAGAIGWIACRGAGVAGASSSRAAVHTVGARAQLVGHASGVSSAAVNGANVMAAIVGMLALCAFAFLVVTFVTHRRAPIA
jgi:hypothetical protein